jgi:hypothetical protein
MNKPKLSQRIAFRLGGVRSAIRTPDSLALMAQTLERIGWSESRRRGRSFSAAGEPVPWLGYPVLEWLSSVVDPEMKVFEYGAGHSTLWFAPRVRELVSTEHDTGWSATVSKLLPTNAEVSLRRTGGDATLGAHPDEYVDHLREYPAGHFDLILIDGMARADCVTAALELAGPETAIVLDNADRPRYREAVERLAAARLCEVDFVGIAPGETNLSCTTVATNSPERWFRRRRPPRDWGTDLSSYEHVDW